MSLTEKIDRVLTTDTVHHRSTELSRLAEMFSGTAIEQIQAALNETDTTGASAYRVAFGWIDKRPFATSKDVSARTELGDLAVIFVSDVQLTRTHAKPQPFKGRCALMQAKLQNAGVSDSLNVLFGKEGDSSSARQLELLSTWGNIAVFEHSTGDNSLGNFSLPEGDRDYGWFMAAHRESAAASQQSAVWLCGKPQSGAKCDVSIGAVIASVAKLGSEDVGVDFELSPSLDPIVAKGTWDGLVLELIRLCAKGTLPSIPAGVAGNQSRLKGILDLLEGPLSSVLQFSTADPLTLAGAVDASSANENDGEMGVLMMVRTVHDR